MKFGKYLSKSQTCTRCREPLLLVLPTWLRVIENLVIAITTVIAVGFGAILSTSFKLAFMLCVLPGLVASVLLNAAANVPLDQRFGRLDRRTKPATNEPAN